LQSASAYARRSVTNPTRGGWQGRHGIRQFSLTRPANGTRRSPPNDKGATRFAGANCRAMPVQKSYLVRPPTVNSYTWSNLMHCRVTNNSCRSRPCTSNIAIQQNTVAKPPPLLDRSGLRTSLTDMSATVEMDARKPRHSLDRPREKKRV